MAVLVDNLLTSIKNRSFMPISQSTFQDSDLMDLAYEVARNYVQPMILATREDYFATFSGYPIKANKTYYPITERALGDSLQSLWVIDDNGTHDRKLNRTSLNFRDEWPKTGRPEAFYLEGSDIVLVPTPAQAEGTLRQYYFRRLGRFVLAQDCAKITALSNDGTTATFTVDTDLTDSLSVGEKVDFLNAQSPYKLWAIDVSITSISATEIGVALTSVQDGSGDTMPGLSDYICPRFKSCIPQLPEEWHTVLAQATVCTLLGSALGDSKKYQLALNELTKLEQGALKTIGNRVEDSPKKIKNRNGILRSISGNFSSRLVRP